MRLQIDINSDVGERPEALRDGSEERLIRHLSSANIACGVHAGDEETIRTTVRLCTKHGIAIGAHPSFPDRENFGRREMNIAPDEIEVCVLDQVSLLDGIASSEGEVLRHVKPHGALYNSATRHPEVATAIGKAVRRASPHLVLVGLAGSRMLDVWRSMGLTVAAEAFADRRYESDGSLRSRAHHDALITSTAEAAEQAVRIVTEGVVLSIDRRPIAIEAQTLCVHSDTPGAVEHLSAIREAFRQAGISVVKFRQPGPQGVPLTSRTAGLL